MEFLDGRIFEDAYIPGVSAGDRTAMYLVQLWILWQGEAKPENRWHDALAVLAKLHRLKPSSVGLQSYGKPTGFYNRQTKTLRFLDASYSSITDIETMQPVGNVPRMEELIRFFDDKQTQPDDKGVIIHGDYKIDNLVFHKTEPRVIGILE